MFFSGPSLTPPVQVCVSLSLTLLACVSICKRDHSSLLQEQRLAGDGGRVSPRRGERGAELCEVEAESGANSTCALCK